MNFEESRLDKRIKRIYGKLIPQSMIEIALRNKDILVNGKRAKASDQVTEEDEIFVHPFVSKRFADVYCHKREKIIDYSRFKEQFKNIIIYEDKNLIIINKPPGLAVQLGTKTRLAVDVMAKAYNPEARLAHRIDKDTSGLSILAKNIETSRYMTYAFKNKEIKKSYLALVSGKLPMIEGRINRPLLRHKDKVIIDFENGREAITEFKTIKNISKNRTLILAFPLTGRTHQIRVHLASIDCPILGDLKYGGLNFKHLCLHSYEIEFFDIRGKKIKLKAKTPEYFLRS
ncbi:MAG: RluA family pseudouridine synthase [Holosporales bacterium]|jgi:23S rRNA pseudouridine955/2504/2580 synthase|nr:RluA family pseudouridine synthase [Holosporales bacterium]